MSKNEESHHTTDEHREGDPSHQTMQYDGHTDDAPSTRVIYAVAEVTGRSPVDLKPLYEVIEPDALDSLVGVGNHEKQRGARPSVSFRYEDCTVTLDSKGGLFLDGPETSGS